ncbi:MAG: DNA polymerase domain-containing protein, partial [Candidatus Woesearchaeota archaeon]
MKGFIVQPSYKITDEKAYIHLYGKLENGESFLAIIERKAYFYIKEEDKEQAEKILPLEIDSLHKKITNFDNEPVIKLLFNSPKEMLDARKILQDSSIQSYEADISFPYRYMIDNNIKGCVDIEGNSYNKKEYNAANNTNYYVDKIFLNPKIKTCDFFPKLKILSFDIETSIKADKLYSIRIYSDNYKKVLINKKGVFNNAESFESEKKVLERFIEIVKEIDPDIITGWNVVDFDLNILREMYKKHQINMNIGRDNTGIYLKLSDNFFQDSIAKIEGRMVIDGISILKQSFISLPDYKLETAAQHFIGHGKIFSGDERHSDIEKAYKKNPEKLIKYNLLDAKLVIDILEKSEALNLSIVRSKLTRMPLDRVKASIASLDSLYLEKLKQRGIVAPTGFTGQRDERIKGGYVKESNPGIYENILVFDFKSLYPSIIRTFNIDPYSFVPKEKLKKYNKEQQQNFIIAPNNAHFRNEEGILPEIIKELWSERDKAKKEKNKLRSNAIKILMNSFFGVLANPNCRFYSLEMANAITHFGQHLIKMTADEITKKEYSVIYGDSVGEDTEIIVKDVKEKIRYIKIHELFDKSIKKLSNRKEYSFQNKFKVLTIDNKGKSIFKKVKYVMRHKNIKQMYRIYLTNLWYIDVTEDHSLIGYINKQKNNKLKDLDRLVEVMPEDLGKMVKSLVTLKLVPNTKITTRNYVKELYELMGLFIGDGSFDRIKNNYYIHIAGG